MSYILGLTGSIGMGKSTTAAMLAQMGLPVWDADGAVHRLYDAGGGAVAPIAQLVPHAIVNGGLDRGALRAAIAENPALLAQIQTIVHPLVAQDRAEFIASTNAPIIVLDIPLLFEIGADALCDGVIVVTAPPEDQRARVLARGISAADFDLLLSRQMPDAEKQSRATWVVHTTSPAHVAEDLARILAQIKGRPHA
ncbi:MAG: dephospho-CoA kinase [Cypionkella sp.]|nr:dephospho-CoA kinase [Cypionkella sp.]